MSAVRLKELEAKYKELGKEIERLKSKEQEPEVLPGMLCRLDDTYPLLLDDNVDFVRVVRTEPRYPFIDSRGTAWAFASPVVDAPGICQFVPHHGGGRPVPEDTLVLGLWRNGTLYMNSAYWFEWSWGEDADGNDIVAYAVINKPSWLEEGE